MRLSMSTAEPRVKTEPGVEPAEDELGQETRAGGVFLRRRLDYRGPTRTIRNCGEMHGRRAKPGSARFGGRIRRESQGRPASMARINLDVNGKVQTIDADPDMPLLYALRNDLGLNNPHFGCGLAQCGACTVHVDGQAVRSCVTPVSAVGNGKVVTLA